MSTFISHYVNLSQECCIERRLLCTYVPTLLPGFINLYQTVHEVHYLDNITPYVSSTTSNNPPLAIGNHRETSSICYILTGELLRRGFLCATENGKVGFAGKGTCQYHDYVEKSFVPGAFVIQAFPLRWALITDRAWPRFLHANPVARVLGHVNKVLCQLRKEGRDQTRKDGCCEVA